MDSELGELFTQGSTSKGQDRYRYTTQATDYRKCNSNTSFPITQNSWWAPSPPLSDLSWNPPRPRSPTRYASPQSPDKFSEIPINCTRPSRIRGCGVIIIYAPPSRSFVDRHGQAFHIHINIPGGCHSPTPPPKAQPESSQAM